MSEGRVQLPWQMVCSGGPHLMHLRSRTQETCKIWFQKLPEIKALIYHWFNWKYSGHSTTLPVKAQLFTTGFSGKTTRYVLFTRSPVTGPTTSWRNESTQSIGVARTTLVEPCIESASTKTNRAVLPLLLSSRRAGSRWSPQRTCWLDAEIIWKMNPSVPVNSWNYNLYSRTEGWYINPVKWLTPSWFTWLIK